MRLDDAELNGRLQEHLNSAPRKELGPLAHGKVTNLRLHDRQGLSNETYTLRVEAEDGSGIELILRLYNGDGKKAGEEFRLLGFLHGRGLPVPRVYLLGEDRKVLGKPFILMERICAERPADAQEMLDSAARSLAAIHSLDGDELQGILEKKDDYPSRELRSIKALAAVSAFSTLKLPTTSLRCWRYASRLGKEPVKPRLKLIHGDCGFDNMVYSRGKAYLIDWESADIAEPTYDVAYAYNLLEFQEKLAGRPQLELPEMFLEAYKRNGGTLRDLPFYRKLAALKLLALIDAATTPGLIALLTGGLRRLKRDKETHLFLENFKAHLSDILATSDPWS
ncbi:MAG: phosphotransferase [Candidatus Bathyarchaeia archaeon]